MPAAEKKSGSAWTQADEDAYTEDMEMEMPTGNGKKFLSREDLLAKLKMLVKTETVELEGVGSVQVRGFTKGEEQSVRSASIVNGTLDTERYEMLALLQGVVEPKLTQDDIAALKNADAGSLNRVLERILALSGLAENSKEQATAAFR